MFTKQHFIQIAQMLKNERLEILGSFNRDRIPFLLQVVINIEGELIDMFEESNTRFDRNKFLTASNPSQVEKELAI